jgi:DNA-binding transcriptional MerR regulator
MSRVSLKKIGEVAELLGTTPRALRFYEEEGLVGARRSAGGTRLYSDGDIARFRAILRLVRAGIPLAMIRDLATARVRHATGEQAGQSVHAMLAGLQAKAREQIDALTKLETELSRAARTLEGCFECANPPSRSGCPECPVNGHLESSEILNLIWEQDPGACRA